MKHLPRIREAIEQPPADADLSREAITAEMPGMITALNWHEPQTQAAFLDQLHAEIAEAKRERDAYRAGAEKLNLRLKSVADQLQRTRQEREEAREAARIIYAGKCSDPREWVERWPWLEETTDG